MAVIIKAPAQSFIQFRSIGTYDPLNDDVIDHCIFQNIRKCLPVYLEDDITFQFVLETTTTEEADELCLLANNLFDIGIVNDCDDPFILEFTEDPERYRLSDKQVLYYWTHGVPNFDSVISVSECFMIKIVVVIGGNDYEFCSNCFERIAENCFSSILEYGNDENAFGFNYCASNPVDDDPVGAGTCEPTRILFTNQSTLIIPYTASLLAMYGEVPTVQVWVYDAFGHLVNMGITAAFDGFPPTQLEFNFGGNASGIIVLK